MRIEGVICDLDGTAVDSEGVHMDAWNGVLEHFGFAPPGREWHEDCIGLPDADARDKTIRLFPSLEKHRDEIIDLKERIFRELVAKKGPALAYPGTRERLERLRGMGARLAIGTNSILANCRASLAAAGLAEYFPVVVTLDQVEHGKPAPDIFLAAAQRLAVPPGRTAVIEDSTAGLAAARAAGCVVLGVENTWPAEKLVPSDFVFPTTAAALDWVAERMREQEREI